MGNRIPTFRDNLVSSSSRAGYSMMQHRIQNTGIFSYTSKLDIDMSYARTEYRAMNRQSSIP